VREPIFLEEADTDSDNSQRDSMRIAIMGTRGIPANYGGFETFVEEMAPRLVQRGHEVTVYGRSNNVKWSEPTYKGVRLFILPTIPHKYFDTVAHTFFSALHGFWRRYDVVLICNSANTIFTPILQLAGKKVAVNVDGLEWKRKKWNALGKAFYRISEMLAVVLPDEVVTDAREIQRYYWQKYRKRSTFIPYGAPSGPVQTRDMLDKLGLRGRDYVLYVSRMEPENNALEVVRAFEKVKTDKRLVMVGDAPYSTDYIRQLRSTQDPRIIFTGYVFGQGYRELQSNAYVYVQATEVGGTHPALLEGMGFGNCVLANDVPEHREVLGDSGIYFEVHKDGDLAAKLQWVLDNPQIVEEYRRRVKARVQARYTWDLVTDRYEALFERMLREGRRP